MATQVTVIASWLKPKSPNDVEIVFAAEVIGTWLPPMEVIPDEFQRHNGTKWNKIMSRWFFQGLPEGTQFKSKPGIDTDIALRHLSVCLRSWEPQHEHKEAGVAYLMSLWFDDIVLPEETASPAPIPTEGA